MINISEINEYLYCKRRYFYIKKIGLCPKNEHIELGNAIHQKTENRLLSNLFFEDRELGVKGKIDYLTEKDKLILYELKKGNSKTLWENDKLQTLAYWYLAKRRNVNISKAYVHYKEGKKFELEFKEQDKEKIKELLKEMKDINQLPERCENTNKCNGCNMKEYCWC
jgi:CRISPR-associated exonuclease Cas4